MPTKRSVLAVTLLVAAVSAAYSNHFQNGFHFDDWHTVTQNPWIRDVHNIPRFFTDARTMSVLAANQVYRPLLMATLALDYRLAGGLRPFWFHTGTFVCYLVLLAALFVLYRRIMDAAEPRAGNFWLALFAAAWFGLHPACAETVNYIVQRADVYVALATVAGLLAYIRFPGGRRWGLYLLPMILGSLFKTTAVMFAPILAAYLLLIEEEAPKRALRCALPALVTAGALLAWSGAMLPKTFTPGDAPALSYAITQPWVTLHYLIQFFFPVSLTADTDIKAFQTLRDDRALAGFLFLALLLAAAWRLARGRRTRPAAFGIWWFLLALLPTAVMPLAEVESDHRMFAAFIGLSLSVTWLANLLRERLRSPRVARVAAAAAACALAAYGAGTWERNRVWRTDETLWADVVRKSPSNGRGLMNYGLTRMEKGDYAGALDYFRRAYAFTPNYTYLEINLGFAYAGLRRYAEAETRFRRALELAPRDSLPYYHYARYLSGRGRTADSMYYLRQALARNPMEAGAGALLAQLEAAQRTHEEVAAAEADVKSAATPENYLQLSLVYHRAGEFEECIGAAREALRLRPGYAEAYNNIAAANESMERWDDAIGAAAEALRIRPSFELARNNLMYAQRMKAQAASPPPAPGP